MSSTPFYIVNAFTTDPHGGNPAAVVIVHEFPETSALLKLTQALNQPVTAFIRALGTEGEPEHPGTATFEIRWFTVKYELPLCGHATLASASIVFSTPGIVPAGVETVVFQSPAGRKVEARRDGEWIEMMLGASVTNAVTPEEDARVRAVASKALGKEVSVKFVGTGGKGFEQYLMVEIEEADDLAGCVPNFQEIVSRLCTLRS